MKGWNRNPNGPPPRPPKLPLADHMAKVLREIKWLDRQLPAIKVEPFELPKDKT